MKKNSLLIIGLIIFLLSGCVNSALDNLKKEAILMNSQCPIYMGMMGRLTAVNFTDEDNSLNFYLTIDDAIINLEELKKNQVFIINSFKLSVSRSDSRAFIEEIINAGSSLNLIFSNEMTPYNQVTISLSNENLKELLNSKLSDREINSLLLSNRVASENAQCPYLIDEGLEITKVEDSGYDLIYYCEADENLYNMDEFKALEKELKEDMVNSFEDFTMKRLLNILSYLNRGYKFIYYGNKTGKEVIIAFTPSELNRFIK